MTFFSDFFAWWFNGVIYVLIAITWQIWTPSKRIKGVLSWKYEPSGARGTHSLPAKYKMTARGAWNGRGGLERFLPLGFWVVQSTFFLFRHFLYEKGRCWRKQGEKGEIVAPNVKRFILKVRTLEGKHPEKLLQTSIHIYSLMRHESCEILFWWMYITHLHFIDFFSLFLSSCSGTIRNTMIHSHCVHH